MSTPDEQNTEIATDAPARDALLERLEFLAAAGPRLLEASRDSRRVLELVADLVVPRLADYCSVREVGDYGTVSRVALRHADPAQAAVVAALERYPPWTEDLIAADIAAGKPFLAPSLAPGTLRRAAQDPEHLRLIEALDPGSLVAVPVVARGRPVGIIAAVNARSSRPFGRAEVLLLEDLARRGGLAIDNARLFAEEQRARAQAEATRAEQAFLLEVSSLLTASLDFEGGLQKLASLVAGPLCDICVVDLFDAAERSIRRVAVATADADDQPATDALRERFPPDASGTHPAVLAIRYGIPQISETVGEEFLSQATRSTEHRRLVEHLGFVSYVSVPLAARGRTLGALTLITTRRSNRRFTRGDLGLVEDLASRAALALDNARLYQETELQTMLLDSQSDATIEGVLVVSPMGRILSFNRRFREMWSVPDGVLEGGDANALLRHVAPQAADPRAFEERVRGLRTDRSVQARDELALLDGRVFDRWTVPLFGTDDVFRGRAWYFRDVTDFKRVQEEHGRLWRAERAARMDSEASRARLQFLLEASTLLAGALEIRVALAGIADLAVASQGRLWAHRCDIDLLTPGGDIERAASAGRGPTADGSIPAPGHPLCPNGGLPAEVISSGAVTILPEPDAPGPGRDEHPLLAYGIGAYLGIPLQARGQVIGCLGFTRGIESGRPYAPDDVVLMQDLARRIALALDHARLFDAQRHIAVTLQASLLPPGLPEIPGVELASRYRSAIAASEVGGDFYDLFPVGEEAWAVVMGDISGKGVEAAAVTALARYTVRAAAREHRQPREVLALLNETVIEEHPGSRFLTTVFGRLRRRGRGWRLTVACGGHPPPLLLRAGGQVERAGRPGTLLGFVAAVDLPEKVSQLAPGDAVVFYTDGLTDVRGPSGTFGEERLAGVLADCRGMHAEAIAARLETEVLAFLSGEARDDLALVVLRVCPEVMLPEGMLPEGMLPEPMGTTSPPIPTALGAVSDQAHEPNDEGYDGNEPQHVQREPQPE